MPVVISLSGADVISIDATSDVQDVEVEIRQYHRDFQTGDRDVEVDEDGLSYEVVA